VAFFNKTTSNSRIVASVHAQQASFHYFDLESPGLIQTHSQLITYDNNQQLQEAFVDWLREHNLKNKNCSWLIGRDSYQSYSIESPMSMNEKLPEKEKREALKWQIKDSLGYNLDNVLISYYKPEHPDPNNQQVTVIATEKTLVESLISVTQKSGLTLKSIEIEELAIGQAILSELSTNKIVGYIGEDNAGLIFNFYDGDKLAFSRHKKGLFIPKQQEFSIDSENEQENQSFLLETQRTMDYVIGQLFRKPIDKLLIQPEQINASLDSDKATSNQPLAETIQQLLDIPVSLITSPFSFDNNGSVKPSLAELGVAMGETA
jgi:Tfp pilus assembly PilM family ATPase